MNLTDILIAALILSASALCIYLIYFLKNLNKSVDEIKNNIDKLVNETLPVISNLNKITEDATKVTATAEKQVSEINSRIDEFKNKLAGYKQKFSNASTDNQVVMMINNFKAFFKGLSAFIKEVNK